MPHVLIPLHRLGSGGVERVTLHLANGLAERGNRVTLVLLSPGGPLEDQLDRRVAVVRFNLAAPRRGAGLLRASRPLARLIRETRPDVLLSPGNHMHPLVLLACRRVPMAGLKLALKFTNPVRRSAAGRLHNALRVRFFRYAVRRADVLLALSRASADDSERLAPEARSKLRTVDNPYVDERLLGRRRVAVKAVPPLLLSVGRLTVQKDPLMLLEAVAGLKDRPWRLAMLGDGPLRSACEQRTRDLGIADRVEFTGFRPDPAPWFDQASLFLLSSRYEELPAVLVEAMAGRCAIVSTAASQAVIDLLDGGRLGRIVPCGDVAAFRAAIAAALDQPTVPEAAERWIQRFTIGNGVASHAAALGLT